MWWYCWVFGTNILFMPFFSVAVLLSALESRLGFVMKLAMCQGSLVFHVSLPCPREEAWESPKDGGWGMSEGISSSIYFQMDWNSEDVVLSAMEAESALAENSRGKENLVLVIWAFVPRLHSLFRVCQDLDPHSTLGRAQLENVPQHIFMFRQKGGTGKDGMGSCKHCEITYMALCMRQMCIEHFCIGVVSFVRHIFCLVSYCCWFLQCCLISCFGPGCQFDWPTVLSSRSILLIWSVFNCDCFFLESMWTTFCSVESVLGSDRL